MTKQIIWFLLGSGLAVILYVVIWIAAKKKRSKKNKPRVLISIEEMKSIGELVAFRMVTKEIVTAGEHWFGEIGKKYFNWLVSSKKMAMIFEFSIDFKYDLRSSDFQIETIGEGNYRLKMPPCYYEIYIKGISFYDEQNAKLLPWLLPDLLNKAFGIGFDEGDKNRLVEEAKEQASKMALTMVTKLQSEVQNSARQTLETISKGFGAKEAFIDFSDSTLVQSKVESAAIEVLERAQ